MERRTEETLTRGVLWFYMAHTLGVPVAALWVICAGDVPLYRSLAQFVGFFPAVLFLALTAMWTELPGRLSKAALLAMVLPVQVGLGTVLMGRDAGFYVLEAFFVDIVAMGLAFVLMAARQSRDERAPLINGLLLVVAAAVAFGGPVLDAYRGWEWWWWVALGAAVVSEAWVYMVVFGTKALPFHPVGDPPKGVLDRLLPDRFRPLSLGTKDEVAVPVVLVGLAVWAILPFVAGGSPRWAL